MRRGIRGRLLAVAVAGSVALSAPPVAAATPVLAIAPPTVDAGALGAAAALSGNPAPLEPTEQRTVCAEPALRGSPRETPIAQRVLDLPAAWQFSRGAGQKVAVIDTGVQRHPRLPRIQAGGDFVSDSDGTIDCDGHGTLVAGIIAAQPHAADGFAGVAPDAEILAIRQLSLAYQPASRRGDPPPGTIADSGYGNVLTLAAAVVRAVDMGATVINISEVACTPAGSDTADAALGAAVRYAYERNVVVVAAAGNVQDGTACGNQNTGAGWGAVRSIASPAWFDQYVLAVGSVDPDGSASALSLHGPWVDVAAIGRQIVSLDSKPGGRGLVDSVQTSDGIHDIEGTSFAAPYVAGLAALIRSRYPQASAQEVMDRITRTAYAPGPARDDRVGAGLIDPVAALTNPIPAAPPADAHQARAFTPPTPPQAPDTMPRTVAVIGTVSLLAALAVGLAVSIPFRRRNRDDQLPDLDS